MEETVELDDFITRKNNIKNILITKINTVNSRIISLENDISLKTKHINKVRKSIKQLEFSQLPVYKGNLIIELKDDIRLINNSINNYQALVSKVKIELIKSEKINESLVNYENFKLSESSFSNPSNTSTSLNESQSLSDSNLSPIENELALSHVKVAKYNYENQEIEILEKKLKDAEIDVEIARFELEKIYNDNQQEKVTINNQSKRWYITLGTALVICLASNFKININYL